MLGLPQQQTELQAFFKLPPDAPINIEFMLVVNQPYLGKEYRYFYPSVIRLLRGNQLRYLSDDTSDHTVEDAEPNNMSREGYIHSTRIGKRRRPRIFKTKRDKNCTGIFKKLYRYCIC